MTKPFEDTSIFQGWDEYEDSYLSAWRVEKTESHYRFFLEQDNHFIYQGSLLRNSKLDRGGIKYRHQAFIKLLEEE